VKAVSVEKIVEEVKKELSNYAIAGTDLDSLFEPLLKACAKVTRTKEELKQCVKEGYKTLMDALKKAR